MSKQNILVDQYIENAKPFAKPVLSHLRHLVHEVCTEVEEQIKWNFPHFVYKGEILCSMAAFKEHCVFGFWKASLMSEKMLMQHAREEKAMGHLGRISSLNDLPDDNALKSWIAEAMWLNENEIKVRKVSKKTGDIIIPDYLVDFLKNNGNAFSQFGSMSNACKREYVEWIDEAKRAETKEKRMNQALEWILQGKDRNWKYKK